MQDWTNQVPMEDGPIREEYMPEKVPTRSEIHVVFVPEPVESPSPVAITMHDRNGAADPFSHRNWVANLQNTREEQADAMQRWQQWTHMRTIPKSRTGI